MRIIVLMLCLLFAPAARAITIPISAEASIFNLWIYHISDDPFTPVFFTTIPWHLEGHGHVNTESLTFQLDSLQGIAPRQAAQASHGPILQDIIIDPPGFDPPYLEHLSTSYVLDLRWIMGDFSIVPGPHIFPIDPINLSKQIAFAPFNIAEVIATRTVITTTRPATTITTSSALIPGYLFVTAGCNDNPVHCGLSLNFFTNEGYRPELFEHQIAADGTWRATSNIQAMVPEPAHMILGLLSLLAFVIWRFTSKEEPASPRRGVRRSLDETVPR